MSLRCRPQSASAAFSAQPANLGAESRVPWARQSSLRMLWNSTRSGAGGQYRAVACSAGRAAAAKARVISDVVTLAKKRAPMAA